MLLSRRRLLAGAAEAEAEWSGATSGSFFLVGKPSASCHSNSFLTVREEATVRHWDDRFPQDLGFWDDCLPRDLGFSFVGAAPYIKSMPGAHKHLSLVEGRIASLLLWVPSLSE